ncbi:MAG: hypothetical protein A2087_02635 [Spirochaetes bacterium GWD1_61_31]|nr:MAG: hypothetical protein A2Y37_03845 [Spirochaetes bacterium GWB1_60_80]OHD28770.1 MAG: hypothetical protein A2004_09220 [Spirochaetes bacterium GWC1_61_12]OHD43411.1 MAG: hypothetical protein A2087_02635 [Spirochaetes bacterium GWD1_61_31]OHD46598.1 MAG: hypothetical protein A2Y35_14835 [Spirochaetes bacterium GWE1_60_18]OHD61032.1 MAG: hypothetical protein A2Y32_05110 [Spirochaetes bacterium GWF1_60_12]HAP44779.1 hypothetical protein [Spirochaetaceae bacterium]
MRVSWFLIAFTCWLLCACTACGLPAGQAQSVTVSIMSYNVMTLFDPVDDGGEYGEFSVRSGDWDEVRYRQRLRSLSEAILAIVPGGPDILVLVEIENERVLADLASLLGGYSAQVMAPDEPAILACGLLARFPLTSARAHLAGGAVATSVPRYMLEAEFAVQGEPLVVLAAHWKSKLGGPEATEPVRQGAAVLARDLMARRLAERPGLAIVLAGDLNENPDEFERVGRAWPTALMPVGEGDGAWLNIALSEAELAADSAYPVLFCPWTKAAGFSYRYAGQDERIDHLLLSAGALGGGRWRLASFSATPAGFMLDADGSPLAWSSRSNDGYSDHLPVLATLQLLP